MTIRRGNGRSLNGHVKVDIKRQEHVLLSVYRYQLSAIMETERGLVALGLLKPEDRRVLSRDEMHELTQKYE